MPRMSIAIVKAFVESILGEFRLTIGANLRLFIFLGALSIFDNLQNNLL
jgi:hypothetical protein